MDAEPITTKAPAGGLRLRLLSERALAERVSAGDRGAFAELFRRYRQPLYGYCVSILGNQEDSADAFQNTMAKALNALPGEEREIQLKPWLFRVARNECIDLVRSRKPTDEITEENQPASNGVEAEVAGRERLQELLTDLEHLPEKQRSALVMRELNGLSFEEIGETFDASPGAAKQVVYEARVSLQELAEGRTMECEPVREAISARDGRSLRGRRLRAHLRSCESCQDFKRGIDARHHDFKALIPVIPAAVVSAVVDLINGPGGGAAGMVGLAGAKAALGGSALKATAVVAVTVTVGAGAVGIVEHNRQKDHGVKTSGADPTPGGVVSDVSAVGIGTPGGSAFRSHSRSRRDGLAGPRNEGGRSGLSGKDAEDQTPKGGTPASGSQSGGTPVDDSPGNSGSNPGGSGGAKGVGAIPTHGGKPAQLPAAAAGGQQQAAEAQAQSGGAPPASPGKSAVAPGAAQSSTSTAKTTGK